MMKKFKINIDNPCNKGWDNMSSAGKGRHCDSCDKVVLDFTEMSDQQLIDFLSEQKRNNNSVCGHFKSSQLNRVLYNSVPFRTPKNHFLIVATLLSGLAFISPACSQSASNPNVVAEQTTEQDLINERKVKVVFQKVVFRSITGSLLSNVKVNIYDDRYKDRVYVSDEKGEVLIPKIEDVTILECNAQHNEFMSKSFKFTFGKSSEVKVKLLPEILIDGMVDFHIEKQ